ncbi:MAG: hypothetical protein KGL39_09765 [Patescibacteria group bacterium]|nr:hypothetical protein [Patescibacteria group bacterium]
MGTNNSAANAANAANAQRQQSINAAVQSIQNAYGSPSRTAQYNQYGSNLLNYYTNQVNEQEGQNARQLKFAMARSGLTGGSAAADANTQLQKDYTQGLLDASRQAQAGKAALQQSDVNAENQLVSLAEQGDYTGALPSEITASQQASLNAAQNYGNANALNNLFKGTAQIYGNEQTAAANRRAQMSPIGSFYGPMMMSPYSGYGGNMYGGGY